MSWAEKDVHGAEGFYRKPAITSLFFLADSVFLLFASVMDVFIVSDHWVALSGPDTVRLLGVVLGMWLLWWKSYSSHRQIRGLYESGHLQAERGTSAQETLVRAAASLSHIGMFMAFLLNSMLLMVVDSLLRAPR